MKIAIGSDHGGFLLKSEIITLLQELGHEVGDHGTHSQDSVDYPDFAQLVCAEVMAGKSNRGILVCGTGIGMSMVANRNENIRAALCHEPFAARMSREHNDANVLCLGERVLGVGLALDIVRTWINSDFAGGRHLRRISMF